MNQRDVVSVIEAAYHVEQGEPAWLQHVLHAATPVLDQGMGCSAFFYDASDVGALRLNTFLTEGAANDEAIMRAIERSAPERVRWVFRSQACRTASEGPDWANQPAAKLFLTMGIADVLFVNGLDPSGVGCFLTAKLARERRVGGALKAHLAQVAAHLAAGYRLLRRLRSASAEPRPEGPAAVLTPAGKVEHAVGDATERAARAALSDAVSAIERARGKLRHTDPTAAVQSWRGLVAARWSLVDTFDRDGKRYVVARTNDAATRHPPELSRRERQAVAYARLGHTNKFIAYELGVSASTVGVLLHRAAQKLGASSRAELVAAFEARSGESAPTPGAAPVTTRER